MSKNIAKSSELKYEYGKIKMAFKLWELTGFASMPPKNDLVNIFYEDPPQYRVIKSLYQLAKLNGRI